MIVDESVECPVCGHTFTPDTRWQSDEPDIDCHQIWFTYNATCPHCNTELVLTQIFRFVETQVEVVE